MIKDKIIYSDFEKLDIRVGKVINASSPEWSEKLLEFEVDFGEETGKRTIFSGIKKYYEPEYFKDKQFIFVVNLADKKMGQGVSQGMMLMVDGDKPLPIEIDGEINPGMQVR